MIDMVMFGKIRRMYFRDKLSINEISRRTSLSRNTVKKWLRQPEGTEPIYHAALLQASSPPMKRGWNKHWPMTHIEANGIDAVRVRYINSYVSKVTKVATVE